MAGNAYTNIKASRNFEVYWFVSNGRQTLNKIVRFRLIDEVEQIYNLELCTALADGTQDCTSSSRNGDMNAVLETTAQIAKIFSDQHPDRKIFFAGSDILRKRQYQIKISLFFQLIDNLFEIEGVMLKGFEMTVREVFRTGINYDGFIFTRRKD